MNIDARLFWIIASLILINGFIFVMWAVMDLSSRISRDEEQQELQHRKDMQS